MWCSPDSRRCRRSTARIATGRARSSSEWCAKGDASMPNDTRLAPDDAQSLAERVVAQMLERDAYSAWLGIELVEVRPNAATIRMTVRPEMLNGFHVCH